jgi:hypothetical protein
MDDAGNKTTPEMTSVVLGTAVRTLCGTVDTGHYDAATQTVDVDTFRVTVDTVPTDLRVRFFADAAGLATVQEFSVLVFDTQPTPRLLNGGLLDTTLSDHGVFRTSLAIGTYDIVVRARNNADVAAPFTYSVRFVVDAPCPALTAKASYTESHDGASNTGNDVLSVDFAMKPSFAMIAGMAEPTGITVKPDTKVRVSGTSAAVTGTDAYMDRDTYEIATDAQTNELSVLLGWAGAGVDLDYVVFKEGTTIETAEASTAGADGSELATFAVEPSTKYWLWVGASKTSTALPATYDVDVCGAEATRV